MVYTLKKSLHPFWHRSTLSYNFEYQQLKLAEAICVLKNAWSALSTTFNITDTETPNLSHTYHCPWILLIHVRKMYKRTCNYFPWRTFWFWFPNPPGGCGWLVFIADYIVKLVSFVLNISDLWFKVPNKTRNVCQSTKGIIHYSPRSSKFFHYVLYVCEGNVFISLLLIPNKLER